MNPKSKKFNLPSLVKDTRTRTSRNNNNNNNNKKGKGPILPGNYSSSSVAPSLWSPYARPPRRSRKLVLLWVGTFLFLAFLMWLMATRRRMANSYADVMAEAPGKEAVVGE